MTIFTISQMATLKSALRLVFPVSHRPVFPNHRRIGTVLILTKSIRSRLLFLTCRPLLLPGGLVAGLMVVCNF
jgi:hypothetical protein